MKINQIVQETTTSGSVAPVEHGFVKMETRNPGVYGNTKAGSLFKGKKTKAPYANSVNESAELSEADLQEDDIIVLPGQGRKLKTGFVPHGKSRVDHEVEMARSDVLATMKNAKAIYELLKNRSEEEGLEGWVQEKLIKANDYLNAVKEYYDEKMMQQESVPPAGVIGNGAMGEGKDDVDSLVTDTEAVMKKFQIDAEQALKTVLGDREYNSRRGFYNFYIRQIIARSKQQGMAEGYDPVESDYQQWEDILVKDGYRMADPSGAHALGLVVGHQLMSDPAEVASTIRNILAYVKQNRQVLGKAVSDRTTVKDAIIDIKNKFPQQYQAASQPQGVTEGKIDFAKKLGKNIDKSNKAVVKTKKEVGSRVADIGAGGKEYNVKTDKAWDDAQKAKKAK